MEKCHILAEYFKLNHDEQEVLKLLHAYTYSYTFANNTPLIQDKRIKHQLEEAVGKCIALYPENDEYLNKYCMSIVELYGTITAFGRSANMKSTVKKPGFLQEKFSSFIPLHLTKWKDFQDTSDFEQLNINNLFLENDTPFRFLIRGIPGSGKTTLLRYLCYRFAQDCIDNKQIYFPVYIRLRYYRCKDEEDNIPISELIRNTLNDLCEDVEMVTFLYEQKFRHLQQILVLLDGLDEIEDEETSRGIAKIINNFIKRYPRCKIIVTSRPIDLKYEDYQESKFQALDILPLTKKLCKSYINAWFNDNGKKAEVLLHTLDTKPRLSSLVQNPFLLTMMCFIYEESNKAKLFEYRSELYKECTEQLLRRSYDTEFIPSNQRIEYYDVLENLKDLSLRFFQWQEADFDIAYIQLMDIRNPKTRYDNPNVMLEDLEKFERDTGLIQRVKDGFTFVHRTLWEFFTALALLDKKKEIIIRNAANPAWEEVVRLYVGLFNQKYPDQDVEKLIKELWKVNRPLSLRVTTEVNIPAERLIKPLLEQEPGNQNRISLIDALEQSLSLIPKTDQPYLVNETLSILFFQCNERDCEVMYRGQELLTKLNLSPLEPGGLIHKLLDLDRAEERQRNYLSGPKNNFQWKKIKGGTFIMGDDEENENEKPEHEATVQDFLLAKHPVTNYMIKHFPFGNIDKNKDNNNHPVVNNTWFEAYYFALWMNARLPTEAEWEFAARGGNGCEHTQYFFGNDKSKLAEYAWFGESTRKIAHAVNEFNPNTKKENLNPLGLANIVGNVLEWTNDTYGYYDKSKKVKMLRSAIKNPRVIRGGSWNLLAEYCRSARRSYWEPGARYDFTGFRLACDKRCSS